MGDVFPGDIVRDSIGTGGSLGKVLDLVSSGFGHVDGVVLDELCYGIDVALTRFAVY